MPGLGLWSSHSFKNFSSWLCCNKAPVTRLSDVARWGNPNGEPNSKPTCTRMWKTPQCSKPWCCISSIVFLPSLTSIVNVSSVVASFSAVLYCETVSPWQARFGPPGCQSALGKIPIRGAMFAVSWWLYWAGWLVGIGIRTSQETPCEGRPSKPFQSQQGSLLLYIVEGLRL